MKRNLIAWGAAVFTACAFVVFAWATDEIAIHPVLKVSKGYLIASYDSGTTLVDMGGNSVSDIVQAFSVGTTSQVTIASGVATNGWCWMRNTTTNEDRRVLVGPVDGSTVLYPMVELRAGESAMFRLKKVLNIYGTAEGGTVNLRTVVLQD
jgi:hypothetical protein